MIDSDNPNIMNTECVRIADGVYWVGTLDWDLRTYHGYTLKGTTYNAYLVFGKDKVVLIDSMYPGTSAQMWGRIADACEKEHHPFHVDVIIQNHIERDHSGALVEINTKFPASPIYCTEVGKKGLIKHYPTLENAPFIIAKTGMSINIGGEDLAVCRDTAPPLAGQH